MRLMPTAPKSQVAEAHRGRELADEMRALPQEEREELMGVFTTPVTISAENALALKADLVIPWNKLRAMRRYVNATALLLRHPSLRGSTFTCRLIMNHT